MKASYHNGRATAAGKVYNANHNTKKETRDGQKHIDHEKTDENKVWIRDTKNLDSPKLILHEGSLDAIKYELDFYKKRYGAARDRKNEDYIKTGHKGDVRTMEQVYKNVKTAPFESIFQIGRVGESVDPKLLEEIFKEYSRWMHKEYGSNIDILDIALHVDEATPHIHARYVFFNRDKDGNLDVNQAGAFRELKIDRPDLSKKQSKYNNPQMTFTKVNRKQFYDICEEHGLHIDREVISPSQKGLEVLEYKTEQQRQKINELVMELDRTKMELNSAQESLHTAQEAEKASQERKELIDKVADKAKEAAVGMMEKAEQQAKDTKFIATHQAKQMMNLSKQQSEQIIENANRKAQEAQEAAKRAEEDKEHAIEQKSEIEAVTASLKEAQKEAQDELDQTIEFLGTLTDQCNRKQAQLTQIEEEIETIHNTELSPSELDKVKCTLDSFEKSKRKAGVLFWGEDRVEIPFDTAKKMVVQSAKEEKLEDRQYKVDKKEREVKHREGLLESREQKVSERERAVEAPEEVIQERINREVKKALDGQDNIFRNKANQYDKVASERDQFRQQVEEYHAIAKRLEIGQGIYLQNIIDAVKQESSDNLVYSMANKVLQVCKYLKKSYENVSDEIKELVKKAKTIEHHFHIGH